MRLAGKTVLVTGSNRGIGKAIVEKMASEGAIVWAHARRQTEDFEDFLIKTAQRYDTNIYPVYFELTDTEQMKAAMQPIIHGEKRIDILVNNAGVAHGGFFAMTKIQTIRDVFDVNLFATMELTQLVLRKMMKQRGGCIINMVSIAAMHLRPGNSAYGTSKAALKAWTETLAVEMAPYGIRVNAIAPSLTDTDMAQMMENKAGREMLSASAMGRLARCEEIANIAVFLATDESSFVNGHTIVANGGGQ